MEADRSLIDPCISVKSVVKWRVEIIGDTRIETHDFTDGSPSTFPSHKGCSHILFVYRNRGFGGTGDWPRSKHGRIDASHAP